MSSRHLHIISFDVPYPANYGGVIDVFYKLKALHSLGIKIYLHCFEYGRAEARHLESFCEKVFYYKRSMSKKNLFHTLPYVVISRSSEKLLENLLRDKHPVLFEGLHSCYLLNDSRLKGRFCGVRMHNIEHDYYENLARVEKTFFRKKYFSLEAGKLQRFEKVLSKADMVAAISQSDCETLALRYFNVHHITAFHPYEKVEGREGLSDYCLYHGNLEVGENNEAALYLVRNIFSGLDIPLVIAGRKPTKELLEAVKECSNVTLKANINTAEIDELVKAAQINILPTFQATGIKLKLLAALFNGRHCIVNTPMVKNTGLESLCFIADTREEMIAKVRTYFMKPFERSELDEREKILNESFSNKKNITRLISLFPQEILES